MQLITSLIIALLLAASTAYATARTATTSCNLTAVDSGCGFPWVTGDTLTVNTGVTVTMPEAVTIGTDTGTGLQLNGTAVVNVSGGTVITMHGDIVQQRGSTVNLAAGSSVYFDPPAATNFVWSGNATGTGYYTINATGTAHSRVTIATTARGGTAQLLTSTWNMAECLLSYLTVRGMGSASLAGFYHNLNASGQRSQLDHVLFVYCGQIVGRPTHAGAIMAWDTVDIRTPRDANYIAQFISSTDLASPGVRTVTNSTFYSATRRIMNSVCRDLSITGSAFYGVNISANTDMRRTQFSGNVMVAYTASGIFGATLYAPAYNNSNSVTDSIFLMKSENAHYVNESAAGALGLSNTFGALEHGNVFDGDNFTVTDSGDFVLTLGSASVVGNIAINKAGTMTFMNANGTTYFENNTYNGGYYVSVWETSGSASMVGSIKRNYFYNLIRIYQNNTGFQSQTFYDWDYNDCYSTQLDPTNLRYPADHPNPALRDQLSYAGAETRQPWFAGGKVFGVDNALNDIAVPPYFIDDSVTVRKFYAANSTTEVGQLAVTRNGWDWQGNAVTPTDKTVAGCLAYIRNGFTPTNQELKDTGGPGLYIGAVPPALNPRRIRDIKQRRRSEIITTNPILTALLEAP